MMLSEALVKLRKMCGSPSIDDVSEDNLKEHIDSAHREVVDKYAFHKGRRRKRINTIAGVDKYSIDVITDTLLKIWDRTNKRRIGRADAAYVSEHDVDGAQRGKPEKYARFENYFQLLPTPDAVYSLELFYRVNALPLINMGDVFLVPRTWDRGVLLLARYYYWSDEAVDAVKAATSLNEFKAWVQDKPSEIAEELQADMTTGVEIPSLGASSDPRLTWDESP